MGESLVVIINGPRPTFLADDNGEMSIFEDLKRIKEIKADHILGVYGWWILNLCSGKAELIQ